jgi:hypothetical protein
MGVSAQSVTGRIGAARMLEALAFVMGQDTAVQLGSCRNEQRLALRWVVVLVMMFVGGVLRVAPHYPKGDAKSGARDVTCISMSRHISPASPDGVSAALQRSDPSRSQRGTCSVSMVSVFL